jgi:cyclomaltodextrinase
LQGDHGVSIADGDQASVRIGTLLLFTFPGAPSIYYGDEIGLTGALPPDRWARKAFPWDHPQRWDTDALAFHKARITLRGSQPALRTGDYTALYADPDVYAFARTVSGSTIITAVNVAETPRRCEIPLAGQLDMQPASAEMVFTTGGSPTIELSSGSLLLALPARSGAVFDTSPA